MGQKSYEVLATEQLQGSFGAQVAFTDDGQLAVTDDSSFASLWNLDPGAWRNRLCSLIDRDFTPAERVRFFPDKRPSDVPRACPN